MDISPPPIQGEFQFRGKQRLIYEGLQRLVGDGPALMYRDACRILTADPPFHTTTHLVMHLFREIESSLRRVLVPKLTEPSKTSRHIQEIEAILNLVQIPSSDPVAQFWIKIASEKELPTWAHRDSLAPPRRTTEAEFYQLVDNMESLFSLLLEKCEENYLAFYSTLETLLQIASPSENDVEIVRNNIPNNFVLLNYFFSRANAEWAEPLAKKHFFTRPPEPLDGMVFVWSESRYLLRVTETKPDKVWEIVKNIPNTQNPYVHDDICEIALKMPADKTVEIVPQILSWLDSRYSVSLPLIVPKLWLHLARGGESNSTLDLIQKLLEIRPNPDDQNVLLRNPILRIAEDLYHHIVEEFIPPLVAVIGEPLIDVLSHLLVDAIASTSPYESSERDASVWIPLNPKDYHRGVQYILSLAVRNAAEQVAEMDSSNVGVLVKNFKSRPLLVFHRLALLLLSKFPTTAPELVADALTEHRYFEEHLDEYRRLLATCFSYLDASHQATILKWINNGPSDQQAQEEDVRRWQFDWLRHISDVLASDWQQRYEELVGIFGDPGPVRFDYPETRVWGGPTSPITAEQLKLMPVKDIVIYLQTWKPSNDFMSPSSEGLARSLAETVSLSPERFAEDALLFRELDPTYIRNLLYGFREPIKQKKIFNWNGILELCRWVIKQPHEFSSEYRRDNDSDPHWGWALGEIAGLLEVGFATDSLSHELRDMAWSVLEPITNDPDPTSDYERQYINGQHSPFHASINTTRGRAMHAIVEYALWVARDLKSKVGQVASNNTTFKDMPEVQEVLNRHLVDDRSLTIRSIYGRYFPYFMWLDKTWTVEAADIIFATAKEDRDLYKAAWEAYLVYSHPYKDVFVLLEDNYRNAIENLNEAGETLLPGNNPNVQLVHHIMTLYWWGLIPLDTSDSLLRRFYSVATEELKEEAIRFLGVSLEATKDVVEETLLIRLKSLWLYRLEAGRKSPSEHTKEMRAFRWWFTSEKFDPEWSLEQQKQVLELVEAGDTMAAKAIIEQLVPITVQLPRLVVECLALLVRENKDGWFIRICEDSIRTILATAIKSTDAQAQARKIINILASRGFPNFGDLLT